MAEFSVLLCTHNRAMLLRQALAALIQRADEKPDQIVIVNGGDERADRVVDEFAGQSNRFAIEIKLVKTKNKNLAASRNVGLPLCIGDIVAMTDDDAEVFPNWVTELKRSHAEHPEAGAVGGAVIGAHPESLISRVSDQVTFMSYPSARYANTLPGVNIAYKRSVLQQVGFQDETLFRGEDVDFNWRIKKLGYDIWYDPAVRVLHYHRPSLRAFLNQHYMYGRAYFLVRTKWPEMYCVYPHGIRKPKDVLKAINFLAAIAYEPAIYASRMRRPIDKFIAYPILLANQVAWRGGMLRQKASRPDNPFIRRTVRERAL